MQRSMLLDGPEWHILAVQLLQVHLAELLQQRLPEIRSLAVQLLEVHRQLHLRLVNSSVV